MGKEEDLVPHPIQLIHIVVKELNFISVESPSEDDEIKEAHIGFSFGRSDFNPENQSIMIQVGMTVGDKEEDNCPYKLRINIIGLFKVDIEKFQVENINAWAEENAPLLLFPYLREQVYALSVRCGYKPLILPLFILPTAFNSSEESIR